VPAGSRGRRIVESASIGQAPIDFDDPQIERGYEGSRAYAQSKLAQISFGFELAERLGPDSGVTVTSLTPSTSCRPRSCSSSTGGRWIRSRRGRGDGAVGDREEV